MGEAETGRLGALVQASRRGSRMAIFTGVSALVAAITLASVIALASPLPTAYTLPAVIALGLLCAVPGAILAVFGLGLIRLGQLPFEMLESARAKLAPSVPKNAEIAGTEDAITNNAFTDKRGLSLVWRLARYLMDARDVLLEGKARLLEAGLLMRLFHPAMLVAVLASIAATAILLPVAVLALLLLLVF